MLTIRGTDLQVSEICLGTAAFGSKQDEALCFEILDRFYEGGGRFLDTAHVYSLLNDHSRSEEIIGQWLRSRSVHPVVLTKGAHYDLAAPSVSRVRENCIREDLFRSLEALGLDCIDLYLLHRDDPSIPIGEILEILQSFADQGLIRYYGASNYSASRLNEAVLYTQTHRVKGFSIISNQWSLAKVNPGQNNNSDPTLVIMGDAEYQFHRETLLPLLPFQATARGYFAKLYAGQPLSPSLERAFSCRENQEMFEKLRKKSLECGSSIQSLVLSELTREPFQVLPVTSVTTPSQLSDVFEAIRLCRNMTKH